MLYPVLIPDADNAVKQGLSIWYGATRATEGPLYFVGVIVLMTMLKASEAMADLLPERAAAHDDASRQLQTFFDCSWTPARPSLRSALPCCTGCSTSRIACPVGSPSGG